MHRRFRYLDASLFRLLRRKHNRTPATLTENSGVEVPPLRGRRSGIRRSPESGAMVSVSVVLAVALPGVMLGGAKAAVTPEGSPVTEKVIGELYVPLVPEALKVYCAVPPEPRIVWEAPLVVSEKSGAVPVPESATVCGEPAALSVNVIEAI